MRLLALLAIAASFGAAGCGTTLHSAAQQNDVAAIQMLLASGASVDALNWKEGPPLYYAAMNGSNGAVKALLDAGADPLRAGILGTPRQIALNNNHPDTAEIIRPYENRHRGVRSDASPSATVVATPALSASDVDFPKKSGAARPDDFALVIGIEDYQSLPKADYGARDAATVRKHFEAMGVPARNIISLEGSQATGSKLKNYLQQWLPRNVKPESTVFVYYSGHGAPDPENGDAYLVPWDADPMFLTTSAYPLKQFYSELAKLKAKRVVVALDACFSGSGGRSVLAKGARPLVSKVDESVPSAANLTVLAAASGSEITGTLDDQAHGIFTYYFLKGLSGGAKTPRALYDYLKPHVQDDARRQNREQSPTLAGSGVDAAF